MVLLTPLGKGCTIELGHPLRLYDLSCSLVLSSLTCLLCSLALPALPFFPLRVPSFPPSPLLQATSQSVGGLLSSRASQYSLGVVRSVPSSSSQLTTPPLHVTIVRRPGTALGLTLGGRGRDLVVLAVAQGSPAASCDIKASGRGEGSGGRRRGEGEAGREGERDGGGRETSGAKFGRGRAHRG